MLSLLESVREELWMIMAETVEILAVGRTLGLLASPSASLGRSGSHHTRGFDFYGQILPRPPK